MVFRYGTGGADRLIGPDEINAYWTEIYEDIYGGNGSYKKGGSGGLFGYAGNDSIFGGDLVDLVLGDSGDDQIFGRGGNDASGSNIESDDEWIRQTDYDGGLYGGGGNDLVDGGSGSDYLAGGEGNDTLRGGIGDDCVYRFVEDASNNYGDYILRLVQGGLHGGDGDDNLYGDAGTDFLSGGEGNDTLVGGAGNDFASTDLEDAPVFDDVSISYGGGLEGGAGRDFIDGGGGTDLLRGGEGDDTLKGADDDDAASDQTGGFSSIYDTDIIAGLLGDAGNDLLDGGAGRDGLSGGAGNDTLKGGDGDDARHFLRNKYSSPSLQYGSERNHLGGLSGDAGEDCLDGGDGVDLLFGGEGDDTLLGGDGDDQRFTESQSDTYSYRMLTVEAGLHGGGGDDLLDGGAGADFLAGDDGTDTVWGGDGGDQIDGGAGADLMYGGTRNDTFYVDDAGDRVFEWRGQGRDEVISTASFDLAGRHIEELTLRGTAMIGGSGNSLANAIRGNTGSNTLMGRGGADNIAPGADSVRDVVLYEDVSDSTTSAFDRIYGFRRGASAGDQRSDKIDLSAFDLTFVETFTNTGRGEVRFSDAGAHVNVVVDLDGSASIDMLIQVRNLDALHEWDLLL